MDNSLGSTVLDEQADCPSYSSSDRFPATADQYELLHEVGHGSTATVWLARTKAHQEFVAVKLFFLDRLKGDKGRAVQEVLTMRTLRHPAILPVLAHFQDASKVWMVTPFVNGGSVSSILTQRHPHGLTEDAIIGIAHPVLQALAFMHELGYMHRDLKAANVLVSEEGATYLADFGVVAAVEHVRGSSHGGGPERQRVRSRHSAMLSAFVGTPAWMAPEVVAPDEEVGYDERADIWSFGILLLEMAAGEAPLSEEPLQDVVVAIANGDPPELQNPEDGRKFSEDFRQLVRMCLLKDPAQRSSAKHLLRHKCFQSPISGQALVQELFAVPDASSDKIHRVPSQSQSMAHRSVDALLREEVAHALGLLQRARAPDPPTERKAGKHHRHRLLRRPHPSLQLTQQDLANCKGLVFGRARKHGGLVRSSARGTGFAIARHVNEEGQLFWSAPTFVHVVGHGVGLAIGAEELSFILVLRDYEHLLTAADAGTSLRANITGPGHRIALQLRLGTGSHTSKLISFADGIMFDMTVLGWNIGPDEELNERVYGEGKDPTTILEGGVRPPQELTPLYDDLQEQYHLSPPVQTKSEASLSKLTLHDGRTPEVADGNQQQRRVQSAHGGVAMPVD